jgi:DNA transposition AAA+ family ATPase
MASSILQPNGLWPREIELICEQFDRLLAQRKQQGRPLSLAKVAQAVDRSASMLSDFVNHKERGDVAGLAERIKNFLELEQSRDQSRAVTIPFCDTQQAKAITQAVHTAHRFGEMVAVVCKSGDGKSRTLEELQSRDRTLIIVNANVMMGPQGLMRDICEAIRQPITGLGIACYKRARSILTDSGRCLIVDDAHDLQLKALHILRSFQNDTRIGLVLCGISTMRKWLTGHNDEMEQIARRVAGNIWTVPEFGEDDALLMLRATMPNEAQVEAALEFLRQEPRSLSSAGRLAVALRKAVRLAEKKKAHVTVELLKRILKEAA